MPRFIDLTGRKFGRLIVIKRSLPNNKWNKTMWLCKCDCGTKKSILGKSLTCKTEPTKSCGCINAELCRSGVKSKKELGFANFNALFLKYKALARKHKRKFELTKKQFKEITQQDCYYCGGKPKNIMDTKRFNGEYVYNGIDRIDNNKGYIIGNIVPCCFVCNVAKSNKTIKEFKNWIEKVYDNMPSWN